MFISFASKVSIEKAEKVAKAFYFEQAIKDGRAINMEEITFSKVSTKTNKDGNAVFYTMSNPSGGWVIVSADDFFRPVLGYSLDGLLSGNNQVFDSWVASYVDQYDYAKQTNFKSTDENTQDWNYYLTATVNELSNKYQVTATVDPLLTCTWNQDYPYNMLCPEDEDGPGGHVYAGCVATAMSMIMYYYKYPLQGTGSHSYYMPGYGTISANFGETTYAWDAMMGVSGSSNDTRRAIAEIQFHCGVSVNMNYDADGSGAYSFNVPDAIIYNFGYSPNATYLQKDGGFSWSTWYQEIRTQLDAEHPLYYSGSSPDGGHAFVCDGYDDADMFHFNFGWGGYDNGFFTLQGATALDYSSGQALVKNFYPAESADYPYFCSDEKEVTYLSGSIEDGSGPCDAYQTNSSCSWLLNSSTELDSISSYKLFFKDFDLHDGDYLTVYEGETTSSPVFGEYFVSDYPEDITVPSDKVLVTFTSGESNVDNQGFRLEYVARHPSYCTGVEQFTEETGTVEDGSGEKNYVPGTMCQYAINVPDATSIKMTFTKFDLDGEGDKLVVYQTNPNVLLAELNGTDDLPIELTSNSGGMHLMFQTDTEGVGDGFSANYEIGNIGVEDEVIANLKVYPNPANDQLNISFDNNFMGSTNIKLIDLTGKIVYSSVVNNGNQQQTLSVSEYSNGVYFLEISNEETTIRQKVVIQ